MENFDLKKFLVENKLTTSSRKMSEAIQSDSETIAQAFQKAGVNMSVPTTVKADFGQSQEEKSFATGREALRYLDNLSRKNNQDEISYEYADELASIGEEGLLAVNFSDAASYFIVQGNSSLGEAAHHESKLAKVIQAAWAEKDINKAKQLVLNLIGTSKIKSKDQIINTIQGISNKGKLDQYLANSLLKFEKLGLNEDGVEEMKEKTSNSKALKENAVTLVTDDEWEYDFAKLEETPEGVKVYYPNSDTEEMEHSYTVPGNLDSLLAKLESLGAVEANGDGGYYATDEEAIVNALESM